MQQKIICPHCFKENSCRQSICSHCSRNLDIPPQIEDKKEKEKSNKQAIFPEVIGFIIELIIDFFF